MYWFTIEFGLCMENGQRKVYGAGILGSIGEMKYALSDEPTFYELDPYEVVKPHDLAISTK